MDDYNLACIIPFMGRNWSSAFCTLLFLILLACTSQPQVSLDTYFYVYRLDPPAIVEFSEDLQATKEIPFSIPPDCGLLDSFATPVGKYLLIELSCPSGQTVLFLDTDSGSVSQPVTGTDSHFLAWTNDGKAVFLKVDSLGSARVVRIDHNGKRIETDLPGWTYDLSARPNTEGFVFTFSRGLGSGSELAFSKNDGQSSESLYADQFNYISFARYAPDGNQIAFIKIPDSQLPFTVGELWVMGADGSNPHKLADADAGHGYAANWSPDGSRIAFVQRENPDEAAAITWLRSSRAELLTTEQLKTDCSELFKGSRP